MIELLAPAGDLEKLKIAYMYGADACYIGGLFFSLRARASNFTLDDLREAKKIASSLNKKLYVTMNIVAHEKELDKLKEYLDFLSEIQIDGVIVTSLYIACVIKAEYPNLELHLSTQASVYNSSAINYYQKLGFTRCVLAREATLNDIKKIKENSKIEIEVFIHGGCCVSFSGRCVLSNYLTGRDANRGGCAHSCRWNYDLIKNQQKITSINFGSKDLCTISLIPELIDCKVDSLKIEGRMKSIYYIAVVTKTYRDLIDDYLNNELKDISYYQNEISYAINRQTSIGFLKGINPDHQLYEVRSETVTKDFLGIVVSYQNNIVTLEQRNYFKPGDKVVFFGPKFKSSEFIIGPIYDEFNNELECANTPKRLIKFEIPFAVFEYCMMRKS